MSVLRHQGGRVERTGDAGRCPGHKPVTINSTAPAEVSTSGLGQAVGRLIDHPGQLVGGQGSMSDSGARRSIFISHSSPHAGNGSVIDHRVFRHCRGRTMI
jgi:hypothetical protein